MLLNAITSTCYGNQVSKSRLVSLIDWFTVFRRYVPIIWYLVLVVLTAQITMVLFRHRLDFHVSSILVIFSLFVTVAHVVLSAKCLSPQTLFTHDVAVVELQRREALSFALKAIAVTAILLWYLGTREKTVYLIDFACFEPPEDWKFTPEQILEMMRLQGCFTEESMAFQERMLMQSGCGPATAWPPGISRCLKGLPRDSSAEAARAESEVCYSSHRFYDSNGQGIHR